ncbi:MAG: DUF4900 domain-containing protein [Kiritimatiellae bacterium]|nr:DUF4900 domain-containing protein [Kiritimatiellia bacterium]
MKKDCAEKPGADGAAPSKGPTCRVLIRWKAGFRADRSGFSAQSKKNESGLVMVIVLCFALFMGILAGAFMKSIGSQVILTRKQEAIEQALHVAEAGVQRASAYLRSGGTGPAVFLDRIGNGAYTVNIHTNDIFDAGLKVQWTIVSTGRVSGVQRVVVVRGLHKLTWAKYAMFVNDNSGMYFVRGEKFLGPVHANGVLGFRGDPEFVGVVTSSTNKYYGSTNNCTFQSGFKLNEDPVSMDDVAFPDMKTEADILYPGYTRIKLEGDQMLVTNGKLGWNNQEVPIKSNQVVYVYTDGTSEGDCRVYGTLDGRMTIIAERDIRINSHIRYADHPSTNEAADDVLGLISGRNVRIDKWAPNDLAIDAHIMATGVMTADKYDGRFEVDEVWDVGKKGSLSVYGGIVQNRRGQVGRVSGWHGENLIYGYKKNYVYDERLSTQPPPDYPMIHEFQWRQWQDM